MSRLRSLAISTPELTVLILAITGAYVMMAEFSDVSSTNVLSASSLFLILLASFLLGTLIAILSRLAGIGGGVIFTPLMLGFTSVDTLVIRATGLLVAISGGLISARPLFKRRIANSRIIFFGALPLSTGALVGGFLAIYTYATMGETGDAMVRLLLGILIGFIAYLFIKGAGRTEFPQPKFVDRMSQRLGLRGSYWEETIHERVDFQLTRAIPGFALFFVVGLLGGFFGMGGGWAVTPVLNLVMATPLKVSAACSGVMLGVGDTSAAWPYITSGALIAMFAVPWMLGQVVGGVIGANMLVRIRVAFVRKLLIAILIFTCIRLLLKGIEELVGFELPI